MGKSLVSATGIEDDAVTAAQAMLLTFTNIGKDTFPAATQAVADMATAMNSGAIPSQEAIKATAIQVGKALQDPIAGVTALQRVGVKLTESQKEQIQTMMESNDVSGAQALILKELQTEFGGAAEAAGDTFGGKMAKMNQKLADAAESLGTNQYRLKLNRN